MDNNRNTRERDQRRGNTANSQAKARAEMSGHRQTGHSEYKGGFDPRSVSKRQPSRVGGSGSRRPSGRSGGNDERTLWTLIVIIGVLAVIAVAMLLKILNTDRPAGVPETAETQTTAITPEQTDLQTDAQTEAVTTVPETQEPPIPVPTFKADLSAYEAYMNPQGAERDQPRIMCCV